MLKTRAPAGTEMSSQECKVQELPQSKVYRHTRTMLKIRSTPTEGEQTAQIKEWSTETISIESNILANPYGTRVCVTMNSQGYASSNTVQPPLPRLDLPVSDFSENREKARLQNHCVQMVSHWKMHLMPKRHNTCHMHQGHASQHEENFGKPARMFSDQLYF